MQIDTMTIANRLGMDTCRLERIVSKEIPEGKLYIEEQEDTHWHRHVKGHEPGPEAYALYTQSLIALEEEQCSK